MLKQELLGIKIGNAYCVYIATNLREIRRVIHLKKKKSIFATINDLVILLEAWLFKN